MSIRSHFARGVLFPLQERLKGHTTLAVHRELERTQWLPPEEVQALQLRRLRSFLMTIGRSVPFYRSMFADRGFDPASVTSLGDLEALPLLDKATIRNNRDAMTAESARGLQTFNTGGSSGEPLIFLLGSKRVSHDVAAKRRATRWWGVDIGDPEIVLWGSPIELGSQDRLRQLRDVMLCTELLPAFALNGKTCEKYLSRIRQVRPAMLFGYPSALAELAGAARRTRQHMDDLGIKVAFVTSEKLYPHQREAIEQTFGCPVANGYGGRDAGFIAHECPEGSMHLTAEDIVVEVIDEHGRQLPPGVRGELVTTHLATDDFPFLRYRTGDIGALDDQPCACGRGLPLLKEIEGRSTDFLTAVDGSRVHALAIIYTLRELASVRAFKVVQEAAREVVVFLQASDAFTDSARSHIEDEIRQRLGTEMNVKVRIVEQIPAEKSGKFRYVVNRIAATELA